MVQMIIKGIFRRYERWNPVHPTYGAFWGMGIGIGCGVGWGPGFGPEVVGYVGAGCGAGFSVGFTLAGVGIGLPMNGLFAVPYNGAKTRVLIPLGSTGPVAKDRNSWQNRAAQHLSVLQNEATEKFSQLKPAFKTIDLTDMKNMVAAGTSSIGEGLGRFGNEVFRPQKGSK